MRLTLVSITAVVLIAATLSVRADETAPKTKTNQYDTLVRLFAQPPPSARPWVYWYFMDGNLTHDGMLADLQSMKKAGIGGAIFLEVNIGIPRGPVDFMSLKWQDLFAEADHEADALGIQIALAAGPGWTGTGGPWIKPELAMQDLVAGQTNVSGPARFSATLPRGLPPLPYFGQGTLTPELKKLWENYYRDAAVLAFPTPDGIKRIVDIEEKALYHRDPFSSRPGVKPFLPAPAVFPTLPGNDCINRNRTIDLTKRMSSDGQLLWDVPPGKWTIMRFGSVLTGQTTRPAPRPGLGFESDKFDRAALDAHYAAYIHKVLLRTGTHTNANGGLTMLHFDSWEMNSQNWSPQFRSEFRRRRGYDPLKFLPVYSGLIVDSEEMSERFLWDVRQTAQELVVQNHVGYLAELAHKNGLLLSVEPYDMNPCADLTMGRAADVPQCEFWFYGFNTTFSAIEAASIAHTCGKSVVAGEAFTSEGGENWSGNPSSLKLLGDWAFCEGVNRFDFHRFEAQPWTNRWPGMTMGTYGVHWDRTETWWDMVPAYHEYLSRCQFLLQRGVTVADVCFLAAEGAPHVFRPPGSAVALTGTLPDHLGYNFDGCAPETLRERAKVKNGKVIFPGGTSYRVLVLPEVQTMTPGLLRKVGELVRAGASVFGPPPQKSPGLQDYPNCDAEVGQLAQKIWGDCDGKTVFAHPYGKGQVLWQKTEVKARDQYGDFAAITNILNQENVPPDFEADGPVRFTHRRDGDTDIYFVANCETQAVIANCTFRVSGKQPELWDPLTGEIRNATAFRQENGRTVVPLEFGPSGSVFVVFCKPISPESSGATASNYPSLHPLKMVSGPWNVSFDPKWGGPDQIVFDSLEDWSQRPEPGIKYYSGKAIYRKSFELPGKNPVQRYILDLGNVKNLARIRLNGHDLGVAWCAPWRVDATDAIKAGTNQLEIEVANLWPNRLIGDLSLPPDQRLAWVSINPFKKDSPLLPSGLLGPVRVLAESEIASKP
ncbi:MAG TPA: glycosyl hydrolase [Verrucomicrobiae bacterium]